MMSHDSLEKLKAGNQRASHSLQVPEVSQQTPFATLLTCSDSRLPVEKIFDVQAGEIFTVRVAGNVVGVHELASIEYGVDVIETPLLIVMGHTHCGAVAAAVEGQVVSPNIVRLVEGIRKVVDKVRQESPEPSEEELIEKVTEKNVWQSIEEILANSPAVHKRFSEGKLEIIAAVYDLQLGLVKWLGSF